MLVLGDKIRNDFIFSRITFYFTSSGQFFSLYLFKEKKEIHCPKFGFDLLFISGSTFSVCPFIIFHHKVIVFSTYYKTCAHLGTFGTQDNLPKGT